MALKCPICFQTKLPVKYTINNYEIVQCENCKLVMLNQKLKFEEVVNLYKNNYFNSDTDGSGYLSYNTMEKALRKNFKKRVKKIIAQTGRNIDLLDVGAGQGFFVDECLKEGIRAEGLEISKEALIYSRKELKIKMYEGTIEEFKPSKKYDVITLWDVIEHVYEPNRFLKIINASLKENGFIFLSTGDIDSLLAKISGPKWHLFNLPEHAYFYSKKTIKKLLNKNNFRILSIEYPYFRYTLGYILERSLKKILKIKNMERFKKVINLKIFRGITIPINFFDIMELKAKK